MPPSPRWKPSEKAYFLNFMDNIVAQEGFRDQILQEYWVRALSAMTTEQGRHLSGGALHKHDPWPLRTYTIRSLSAMWRKTKAERQADIPDEITQEDDPEGGNSIDAGENELNYNILDSQLVDDFEAQLPEEWEREFEERLVSLRCEWAKEAAAQETPAQEAFKHLLHIAPERTILPYSPEEGAAQLIAILEEPALRHSMEEAAKEILIRMGADQTVQTNFWDAFEKRFSSQ